jgi:DNA polymerase-3 subunit beta
MIERTMYAASVDETRYNLNGVYFEVMQESQKIRMVATDGHRLALVDRGIGGEVEGLASEVIIPRKGLAELKRLVDEDDADQVEIGFEGSSGLARKNSVTLMMRLIEGKFPNYQQVIPTTGERRLTLPSEPLLRAVRRVALLSVERSHAVKLELASGVLSLSSSNPDLGQAREELDVDYAGDPLTIGFNAKYLQESLAAFGAKEIELCLHDASSPVIVRPTDDEESLAVVMPMRL